MDKSMSEIKELLDLLEHADAVYAVLMAQSIAKLSPFSAEINKYIRTADELEVYKQLDLREGYITRPSLLADIDIDYYDFGKKESNLDKMLAGSPPIDVTTMQPFDLHHIGQQYDAPFAELPRLMHIGIGSYGILHDSNIDSWRLNPRMVNDFAKERADYWRRRGELLSE